MDPQPFTVDHFRSWASQLILDNGEKWVLEPFQEAFLGDFFEGVSECWLIIPEGNGKTTMIAGLGLYHCQFHKVASVGIAASSREQAGILFRQAAGFVSRSELADFRVFEGYRRIDYQPDDSRMQVFAADDRTGDGVILTLGICDELHRHKDLRLYRVWVGKRWKRNAQTIAISTAGEPGAEFERQREKIRQGCEILERTETFVRARSKQVVLHEWAVPESGDVEDMELVSRANPFSGITQETLKDKFESESMTLAHWRRFTCNLPTRGDFAAIQEKEWWDAKTEEEIPVGIPVAVGLDVGWKWDTTAAVPLWLRDEQFRLFGPAKVLVPPRDGNSLDPTLIEVALIEIHKRNPISTLVMDMSRAEQLASWAQGEFGCRVVDRGTNNAAAAEDYERFMGALRQGWIRHAGDDGFSQHALNAVARVLPQGDARFERPAQSRNAAEQDLRTIDALVAAAMVNTVMAVNKPSVYETRGIVSIDDEPEEEQAA